MGAFPALPSIPLPICLPLRPLQTPQPAYTVRPKPNSSQKIPYLPSDHSKHHSRPTQCGQNPTQVRKFPISPPTTPNTTAGLHSAAKTQLKSENSPSPLRPLQIIYFSGSNPT